MSDPRTRIYTVGHSNRSAEDFLTLLVTHGIEAIADVRSAPYSRYNKHFCKEPLTALLKAAGIHYVYLGDTLGGRPQDPTVLDEGGQPDYEKIAAADSFAGGIERLVEGSARYRLAILCAEENPRRCHRRLLVTPALVARDLDVFHIRTDGLISETALANSEKDPQSSLF